MAGTDGSQILLEDLLDPVVPGPHNGPVIEDADGWNKIDQWCVWECTLCEYPTMLDIPGRYREIWASAVDRVFTAIAGAEGGLDLERGLKWFLILPTVIFRQGRRGGKAGKGQLSQRVNRLVEGDWGGLLELLEKDCRMLEREDRRNRNRRRQRQGQRRSGN